MGDETAERPGSARLWRTRLTAIEPWGGDRHGGWWRLGLVGEGGEGWGPGQFAMVAVPGSPWRPYFAASETHAAGGVAISLWIREYTRAGAWLQARPVGSIVELIGPLGRVPAPPSALVAVGRGPEFFAVAASLAPSRRVWLGTDGNHAAPGAFATAPADPVRLAGDGAIRVGLLVGLSEAEAAAWVRRWPSSTTWYAWRRTPMPCGVGACWGCAVALRAGDRASGPGYARACVDGPFMPEPEPSDPCREEEGEAWI